LKLSFSHRKRPANRVLTDNAGGCEDRAYIRGVDAGRRRTGCDVIGLKAMAPYLGNVFQTSGNSSAIRLAGWVLTRSSTSRR